MRSAWPSLTTASRVHIVPRANRAHSVNTVEPSSITTPIPSPRKLPLESAPRVGGDTTEDREEDRARDYDHDGEASGAVRVCSALVLARRCRARRPPRSARMPPSTPLCSPRRSDLGIVTASTLPTSTAPVRSLPCPAHPEQTCASWAARADSCRRAGRQTSFARRALLAANSGPSPASRGQRGAPVPPRVDRRRVTRDWRIRGAWLLARRDPLSFSCAHQ